MTMVSSPSRSPSMASRRSHSLHAAPSPSSSELTLALPDVVQGFLPSPELSASQDQLPQSAPNDADNIVIAPWLAPESEGQSEPPTPPPKQQRFGFASKSSIGSFSLPRQPSVSTLSVASTRTAGDSYSVLSGDTAVDARRSKASLSLFKSLGLKRSRSKLRADERPTDERVPPMPPSPPPSVKRVKKNRAARPPAQPQFTLDTNFTNIDEIVDLSRPSAELDAGPEQDSAAASAFEYLGISPATLFTDPFHPGAPAGPSTTPHEWRRVPPKVLPEPPRDGAASPSWTAPESWAVEKDDEQPPAQEQSSEDEEPAPDPRAKQRARSRGDSVLSRRAPAAPSPKTYNIRIYRPNGTYHVATIEFDVTVAELKPVLDRRLLPDPSAETHRLYLKERGRERILAQNEKPASILRRRLEQAGYQPCDGLDKVGREDTQFLLRFSYKSNVLGTTEEDVIIDSSGLIELTGRGLRTVPIALYTRAEGIVSLNLSRNPMVEIPLDFIQSCTQLRELRLQNMAMKKVPQSVRHCRTLHRLDLSSNRIVDLEDAGLDGIPALQALKLQNNRLERLPAYFPQLSALRDLNISNNHFRQLPPGVSALRGLVDLDISFNSVGELPDEIGQLRALERFIIVGNKVSRFPDSTRNLVSLRMFDCRRNHISDLAAISTLPKVEQIYADHNMVHALDLSFGASLEELVVSHNDITQINLIHGPLSRPFALTYLDISHAKLSSLDESALAQLTALRTLRVDNNSLRSIPDSLGTLTSLVHLSCSNNQLLNLPSSIGRLQKLETLEAHNNSLGELPSTLWVCPSLQLINATSNFVSHWRLPHLPACDASEHSSPDPTKVEYSDRKPSWASTATSGRPLPPLAAALEKLYLGENKLTDDSILPLSLLKELRVLNLSFNEIQDLPTNFLRNLTKLRELYLSGNSLSGIPTEDLYRLTSLEVLFLNGNKLQTLPKELGKVPSLSALDVGSNVLRYNVFNWEFDWNWNFNTNLRYLNLSGNKRLEIRPDMSGDKKPKVDKEGRKILGDFSELAQLRVLGLMDVTWTGNNIPDENEERRIRTSSSEVNGMGYGIADTLGVTDHINMLDLVQPVFRDRKNEALFAMFGRASHTHTNHLLNKFLHVSLVEALTEELEKIDVHRGEGVGEALRRTFLRLNKDAHVGLHKQLTEKMKGDLHEEVLARRGSNRKMSTVSSSTLAVAHDTRIRGGASGIVLYFADKTLYVANVGDALAVVSRQGVAELLSFKHDPFDRQETARIRTTEGWVSPKGFVNDDIEVARSFGFYDLVPVVNATPFVRGRQLSELDEFVIVGNSGLWDFVSYQTAVDIARTEKADPMIAAQKLRDFAISYGAEGTTMIMVISVADLFNQRSRLPTVDFVNDAEELRMIKARRKEPEIADRALSRLDREVPPPTGHVALVFTDIRNSTHLWEVNPGMPTAMYLHNSLLRRQLRLCGGYEVKTEGDAFMCSFPTTLSAVWWALRVQLELLNVDWPLELLECDDGKEIYDQAGRLIARGLSVRIGVHCGNPVCEPDPITKRMDYFGPMVNRASRVEGKAAGGQIMCSADVIRELRACVLEDQPETEWSSLQPKEAIEGIKQLGVAVVAIGEVKLKGLEAPEILSAVYPQQLAERHALCEAQSTSSKSGSRVQFSVEQMKELALLCLRLEALASSRIFRPLSQQQPKAGSRTSQLRPMSYCGNSNIVTADPRVLLPTMENASDVELLMLLDSLTMRIENALSRLSLNRVLSSDILQSLSGPPGALSTLLALLAPPPSGSSS